MLIQYILNEGPPDDFAAALSDLNQDTAINVMDVVALVDKALGLNQ